MRAQGSPECRHEKKIQANAKMRLTRLRALMSSGRIHSELPEEVQRLTLSEDKVKMSKNIVIVDAVRTAVGNFGGSLASLPATELGARVVKALVERTGIAPDQVNEVIMGQVLTGGAGQNPARQSAVKAGLPYEVTAMTINKVCGSGLKAVHLAMQAIACGDADIVIAGGQESMSQSGHVLPRSREGQRMGDWKMKDTMIVDGLWDAFNQCHMGITAENVAKKYGIGREDQDEFAVSSQQKAEAAQKAGRFDEEIIPVTIPQRRGDPVVFASDEFPRHGATAEKLAKLRPAFDKEGSVTAGNASGINDGAAAVVVMTESKARELGLTPMARIVAFSAAGVDPSVMGTGPIPASTKCLEKAGWSPADLDLVEANEAFAAQAMSVNRDMGWDVDKVNVNGGAIAIGHPIGASGARVLVSLLYEMKRRNARKGLATLCIGGGQGVALAVERD
jgi:acetyl-CoA C-acetyltransferase